MTGPSTIRIAGPNDFEEVWRLLLLGYDENALFRLSEKKAQWFVRRALSPHTIPPGDTGTRGVIGVIGSMGALEGLAFLTIGSYWYTEEHNIEEFIVFVDPDHRKSNHAKALISWMSQQPDEVGLPLITGILSNTRTEAKCRLYSRLMPKAGEFFLVKPKNDTLSTVSS
jgi:GNAT superfamily N-acetyltransferase